MQLIVWVTDVSVCVDMSVIKLFSNHYFYSYSFYLILTKIGIHDLCANMQKLWNRFSNFDFKLLVNLLNLNLDLVLTLEELKCNLSVEKLYICAFISTEFL